MILFHILADHIKANETIECRNPEPLELQRKLLNYEMKMSHYRAFDSGLNFSEIHHHSKRSAVYESLCPMVKYVEYSANSFPFRFTGNECKCEKCRYLSKENYRCVSLLEERYFLKKGECLENGYYQWYPFIKNMTVGCACKAVK